eukprot:11210450-Lingulodinium_polyedra.AAC.1
MLDLVRKIIANNGIVLHTLLGLQVLRGRANDNPRSREALRAPGPPDFLYKPPSRQSPMLDAADDYGHVDADVVGYADADAGAGAAVGGGGGGGDGDGDGDGDGAGGCDGDGGGGGNGAGAGAGAGSGGVDGDGWRWR